MLIKIDNTIVGFIRNNILTLNTLSPEILALNHIADAYREGDHLVVADVEVLEFLTRCILLNNSTRLIYEHLKNRIYSFGAYESLLTCYILVHKKDITFNRMTISNVCHFEVPLERLSKRMCLAPTFLVSEHQSDCEFYIKIAKRYISEIVTFNGINIKMETILGGGDSSSLVYKYHISQGKICLAIADSDKSYPHDQIGDTLLGLQQVFQDYKYSHIIDLYALDVREKENLVSPSVYLMCTNSSCRVTLKKLYEIEMSEHREKLKYIDIKGGLNAKSYLTADSNWLEYYEILFKEKSDLLNCGIDEICTKDEKYVLIDGIGGYLRYVEYEILDGKLEDILNKKIALKIPQDVIDKINKDVERSKSLFSHLPDYLQEEWKSISEKILAWGCCSPEGVFNT